MNKSYSELLSFSTYENRLAYLRLNGKVGLETFGFDRYLNQAFYMRTDWRCFRSKIILRDNGCDMALPDYAISGSVIIIHHINPVTEQDILRNNISVLLNPENAVCVSLRTHNAIHYGYEVKIGDHAAIVERSLHDTCPWRK